MEIIKKYVYAVQRRLPAVGRDDIVKEINSLIYDELEGKFGKKDSYSNEEAEEVLKEMGHPREVAARYRGGSQTFIGSELLPLYSTSANSTARILISTRTGRPRICRTSRRRRTG